MATCQDILKQNVEIHYSNLQTLACVEYPGRIVNPDKAMQTLGGVESLAKVHKTAESRIQLRFRPDDIYCKVAHGTRYPTNSVLLKVKRKRNKRTGETKLSVELVGVIATTYKFATMMDYQYLTVERDGDKYKSLHGLCTIETMESLSWMDNGAPLHFMPQIFSPLDIPYAYHFKEEDNKKSEDEVQHGSLFGTARKKRMNYNQIVSYDAEIPMKPTEGAEEKIRTPYLQNKMTELRKLFDKRPIWTRAALNAVTKLNYNRLKVILPCVAYNSISGPWRTMWIRHGYDPKQNVEAKHYQLIDYRYRARDKTDQEKKVVMHKRSYSKYLPSITKSKPKVVRSDQLEHLKAAADMEVQEEEEMGDEERKMQYMLWPGVVPPYRQLFYQICDIELVEVQEIVNSNNGKEPECTKAHGFLVPNSHDKIRAIINKHVLKAIQEMQARSGALGEGDEESEDGGGSEIEAARDEYAYYDSRALESYR